MFSVSTLRYDGEIITEPGFFEVEWLHPLEESPNLEDTVNPDTAFYEKELGGLNKFGNIA